MNFLGYYEQQFEKGEDAFPTLMTFDNQLTWLGVYDGLGGSGSKLYTIIEKNQATKIQTGAYLASRKIKEAVECFLKIHQNIFNTEDFCIYLKEILQVFLAQFKENSSTIKSKLLKSLPTTLCLVSWKNINEQTIALQTFNAGDSRVYVFTPQKCQILTKDDLEDNLDALENLRLEGNISNCISADSNFFITQKNYTIEKPALILVATDGVFHYFETPMHFEYFFLQTLINTQSDEKSWESILLTTLIQYSSDDISFAISAVGFKDFFHLQNSFYSRYQFLYENFIEPLEKKQTTAENLWHKYQAINH